MGFPPLLNLSTRLSTAALPGQTTKMAQTLESMFQNVAYRPTVYRTGVFAHPSQPRVPKGCRVLVESKGTYGKATNHAQIGVKHH